MRRWYSAIGATLGVGLLAGGAAALMPRHSGPHPQAIADPCGLIKCEATARPSGSPSRAVPDRRPSPTPDRHATGSPSPSHSSPVPTRSASPADVTVAYALDHPSHSGHHFRATVTLTNHAHDRIPAWTLTLSLPGDSVDWVGGPDGDFSTWAFHSGTLTVRAAVRGEWIGPGSSVQVSISGRGPAPAPVACTFDGIDCQP